MTARVHYLPPQPPRLPPGHRPQTPRTERVLLALARAKRAAHRAALRYVIESNGRWIEARAADGILDSQNLRACRQQMAADYVRLATLEESSMEPPKTGRRFTRGERTAFLMVGLVVTIAAAAGAVHVIARVMP